MDLLNDWLVALLRWGHVLAGITWVGTSFYFNWFDLSVRKAEGPVIKENVRGTLTEVHGGSFYYHEQFWPSEEPPRMLHHSGPAQLTFLTGGLLLAMIYWLGAGTYLIDAQVMDLSPWAAVAISAASLALGWLLYHRLCLMVESDRLVFAIMVLAVSLAGWGYLQVFNPRAALLHMGALLGTIMALNVVFVIVPNHIGMREQIRSSKPLDTNLGEKAKRHSQHNNYFTLPVVFAMVGIHFPLAFGHPLAWLVLPLVMVAGVAFRHFRNVQMQHDKTDYRLLAGGLALLALAIAVTFVDIRATKVSTPAGQPSMEQAMSLIRAHCTPCHSRTPTDENFAEAPAGLALDGLADIKGKTAKIYEQTVRDRIMPLGNSTGMTEEERALLGIWLKSEDLSERE